MSANHHHHHHHGGDETLTAHHSNNMSPTFPIPVQVTPTLPISPNNPRHLVYVRRKPDVLDLGKTCTNAVIDTASDNSTTNNAEGLVLPQPHVSKEVIVVQPMPQMDESKLPPTDIPAREQKRINEATEMANKQREQRHMELQLVLSNLDRAQQEENLQFLRSLTSLELSRYAVELEKRSIQLSLEEAKELIRVGELDVLGKSTLSLKPG